MVMQENETAEELAEGKGWRAGMEWLFVFVCQLWLEAAVACLDHECSEKNRGRNGYR